MPVTEVRVENPDVWDEMVEEVLGPEWLSEDRFDQLAELIKYNGDPHAARQEIEGALD